MIFNALKAPRKKRGSSRNLHAQPYIRDLYDRLTPARILPTIFTLLSKQGRRNKTDRCQTAQPGTERTCLSALYLNLQRATNPREMRLKIGELKHVALDLSSRRPANICDFPSQIETKLGSGSIEAFGKYSACERVRIINNQLIKTYLMPTPQARHCTDSSNTSTRRECFTNLDVLPAVVRGIPELYSSPSLSVSR
jgi:hypothetical protein